MLWRRLGLNRAIDVDDVAARPQMTTSKRKGESTVYFIKLPPGSNYYATLNHLAPSEDFKKVSMDFTANGKPASVYHWNLPVATTTTTRTTSTTPAPRRRKTYLRTHLHNNGKPSKIFLVEQESFNKGQTFKQI